jgi:predicted transposase/invertase (TIGR01784 family)
MGEFDQPFDGIPADSEQEFSAKIADVDIRDDFMFSYVMCNRQICTELLQYLLPDRKISRIEYYELGDDGTERPESASQKGEPLKLDTQKSLNEAFNRRTVRLDVYIDDGKSVYNLEMQTTRHAGLAKRARLYQAHMDINQLQRGQFYTRLRPSFVIFICTFDPFDEGRYLYSFHNVCRETGAELDDEAYKLFFNTAGTRGEISDSLREILRYMNDPKNYPVEKAELPLIRSIDEAVNEAKMSNEWRHAYMIYQIHQQDAEMRGRAMGREEGIAIGEERGEKRNMVKTANKMLSRKMPVDLISELTGLSVSEINKLKTAPSTN